VLKNFKGVLRQSKLQGKLSGNYTYLFVVLDVRVLFFVLVSVLFNVGQTELESGAIMYAT
jgi:NADH:ubiquinone oxidoreductase subunit 3 (subunit A)